jgi:hypothetical protein
MKKKKDNNLDFDPEVLRMYLMGATWTKARWEKAKYRPTMHFFIS